MRLVHPILLALIVTLAWPSGAAADLTTMAAAADLLANAPQRTRGAVASDLVALLWQTNQNQMAEQFPHIDALTEVADKLLQLEVGNRDGKQWVMSETNSKEKVEAVARRPNGSLNKGPLQEIEARKWLGDGRTLQAVYGVGTDGKLVLHRLAIAVEGPPRGRSYALVVAPGGATLLAKEKGRQTYFSHGIKGLDQHRSTRIKPLGTRASTWVHQRLEPHAGKL